MACDFIVDILRAFCMAVHMERATCIFAILSRWEDDGVS
jgi:hypothetical protein